jgi:sigma-E factor negative regulatory protein RseC
MSNRLGIVRATDSEGYAQVETERKTACGECNHIKVACYGCILSPKIIGRVANPIGAKPGDIVKIHLASSRLFLAAGMFYLLPIFTLLAGALTGNAFSDTFGTSETTASIIGAVSGLTTGMIFVTVLGRMKRFSKYFEPVITSISGSTLS